MNLFYLFNGFNKFIEGELKLEKEGMSHLSDAKKQELKDTLKLINSNKDKKETELMQIFDCDPNWPICLYDFTFKNRNHKYISMRCRESLNDYVYDNYFDQKTGLNTKAKLKIHKEA